MPKASYIINNIQGYEELASHIEMHVQRLLEDHNYNTVGNFLKLYRSFKASKCSSLVEYFPCYNPPITPEHHTCVGLALELWNRLHQLDYLFPELSQHLYLVSCEENIEELNEYIALCDTLDSVAYTLEKEHVLLCLKFSIDGREGVLLCDPGYHVSRAVTVMYDKAYPHTGWFIQSEEGNIRKEYNYQFSINGKFVEWNECTTRNDVQKTFTGLIYVAKPYLTAVDVTERRNLVYNFRSLLSRNLKGHLIAGIYFKLKEGSDEFTLFYQDITKKRIKMNFFNFLENKEVSDDILKSIRTCNEQLKLPENSLLEMIREVAEILNNTAYLRQILDINNFINIAFDND